MTSEPTIPELLAAAIKREAPLSIDEFYFNDPTVRFSGPGWSLGVMAPWRLLQGNAVVLDLFDQSVADNEDDAEIVEAKIRDIVGASIIEARPSTRNSHDPVLVLTDGYAIEIEADTDLDPWVFRLSGDIFVGVMTQAR